MLAQPEPIAPIFWRVDSGISGDELGIIKTLLADATPPSVFDDPAIQFVSLFFQTDPPCGVDQDCLARATTFV